MTEKRKEPRLSGIEAGTDQERIPTLSEVVSPDLFERATPAGQPRARAGEAQGPGHDGPEPGAAGEDEDGPRLGDYDFIDKLVAEPRHVAPADTATKPAAPAISAEEIETLSDRVLDQVAPALREAVTAAVTELLNRQDRDGRRAPPRPPE